MVEAAAFAPSIEIRHFLIDLANKKKFSLKTGMNDYHLAAISGWMQDFDLANSRKSNPDSLITSSPRGLTYRPIHLAFRLNNSEIIEALLAEGVDIDSPNSSGKSALAIALEYGSNDAAEILIASGADVNHRDSFLQSTPLFNISDNVNREILDRLLENGADLNEEYSCFDYKGEVEKNHCTGYCSATNFG